MASQELCAICLGTLNAGGGQALFTAECSHTFHFSCIASSVQHGNHICPTCRATWVNLPSHFSPTSANVLPRVRTPPQRSHLFADDEPLPIPSPVPVNTVLTTSPVAQNGDMTVKALPEYPALSKSDQSNSFPILVGIRAPPLSPEASDRQRAPLDLIAVLDVSGSMNGDKIRLLKEAVEFVVNNLGPMDRLSVITFATSARRVTPLRRMTDDGRGDTMTAVNSLRANGSTNIIAGLIKAVEVLDQRREKNPVSSIILLSDGQDNQNGVGRDFLQSLHYLPPCLRANDIVLNVSQSDSVPVHTFGFGADHDATALHAIADGSGGTFSYIESIEIIQDAFAQCIGGLLSVVAQEAEINLTSGSQGVQILSIPSGRYRNSIDTGGQNGAIYIGDVYAEEEKQFLVYVSVPPADYDTLTTQLLMVKCSYKDPLFVQNLVSESVCVEIRRPLADNLSEEDRQVCLEVDRERNRISISEGITEAQAMAERGELSGAQSMLEQRRLAVLHSVSAQAGDALSRRLESELREIQESMRSREEYETGGRAFAFSRSSAHGYQRASTQAMSRIRLSKVSAPGDGPPISFGSNASGGASPERMDYQTSFMKRMVRRSQQLRSIGDQGEGSTGNSNKSN